jgi:flagellin
MTSILTNTGAMTALQTLRSINQNLTQTQNEISTGKTISSAKDNSAIWAISKVMESDVAGFKAIKSSLSLGESTVATARAASESITKLLTDIKGKIVASQEENVDRDKIQTDITRLREQIESIVDSAQFNGLNLLKNTSLTEGTGTVRILSSLDRASNGAVSTNNIDVGKRDLSTKAQSVDIAGGTAGTATSETLDDTTVATGVTLEIDQADVTAGLAYILEVTGAGGDAADDAISYVARDGDTAEDVARALQLSFNRWASENNVSADTLSVSRDGATLTFRSTEADATNSIDVSVNTVESDDNVIGGGLGALSDVNVSTRDGAVSALAAIEGMIQTAIDASAAFGSAQSRIEIQSDFVSKLTDSLRSGIGSLVDADLEEASARLQALQVQQQLGIQSLSIANQAPQTILALFR